MNTLSISHETSSPSRRLLAVLVLLVATNLRAAEPLHLLTYSGDQAALVELDREINAAGIDPAKLAAIEQRLFAALRRNDLTFAARQAICQRLGRVLAATPPKASADACKPLGAMLADERDSDLARLALEPARGATIDELFLTALGKTSGRTRIGLIDSLGRRRTAAAIDALRQLLRDTDAATAAAAANALARIGTPAALAALRDGPSAPAVIEATIAAAQQLAPAQAVPALREIENDSRAPAHLRAAAFRTALELEPASATERLTRVLAGNDVAMKQAALEAVAVLTTPNLVSALAASLASWDAPTQAAVIAAFGRGGEAAALPVVSAALAHPDADVRRAAIQALGSLPGNRDTVAALARIAAGSSRDDARLARQSLARLNGPDVSRTILDGARRGEPALRTTFLEQLALRNMTEALPLLLETRSDPEVSVRTAAVAALGDLAPVTEQAALIDWTVRATDEGEQSRALRALVTLTLRNPDVEKRGRLVYAAIEKAEPGVALRLLPALPRLGGAASANCAVQLAVRADRTIADAAVATLDRWTDDTALPALATIAERAALPDVRATAVKTALRTFERRRSEWSAESTDVVARLLASATETDSRQALVGLLARAKDERALALAEKLASDPTAGERARYAAAVIRANRAGPPSLRASGSEGNLRNILDGKPATRWNVATAGDEWLEIDFKVSRPFERITLDQTGRAAEYPERYEVFVTDDVRAPGPPRASGQGEQGQTVINLPPGTKGRYLMIKNTRERAESQWAIAELIVE